MNTSVLFTCEIICWPEAKDAGSTSVLIKHKLVLFAGSAGPTAAHLSFADHLETHTVVKGVERSQSSNGTLL